MSILKPRTPPPPFEWILDECRAQFRPGGRPVDLFLKKAEEQRIDKMQGDRLVVEILQSFQERLCALEETR